MKTVKAVKYIDGYRLKLLFDDNKTKIVDLTDVIKKGGYYFKPLQDIEFFKQVSLDDDEYPSSICWPNGADFCPDVLYEIGVDVPGDDKSAKLTQRTRRRKAGEKVEVKYQAACAMTKKRSQKV